MKPAGSAPATPTSLMTQGCVPPHFESYEAFRAHIHALVERREREVREGRLSIAEAK